MKKLLLSTVVLFLFSASILIFQLSCKKSANATKIGTQSQPSGLILLKRYKPNNNYVSSLYTSNLDGSNLKEIPLEAPLDGLSMNIREAKFTADGKNIVFEIFINEKVGTTNLYPTKVYTCAINGSNLKELSNLAGHIASRVSGIEDTYHLLDVH